MANGQEQQNQMVCGPDYSGSLSGFKTDFQN